MNPLLLRQVRRATQIHNEDALQALYAELRELARTQGLSAGAKGFLEGAEGFMHRISLSYDDSDRNMELYARSLQQDSEELEAANRELRRVSSIDSLTKLWNRGYWWNRLQDEFNRARRFHSSASLLILDIDHFKKVNDKYGHPVGDVVLCELAELLKKYSRKIDVCARYGGEEFSVVLPSTPEVDAFDYAERIREAVAEQTYMVGDVEINFTVSIGIAGLRDDMADVDSWLVQADNALYEAKRAGRNRTCQAGLAGPESGSGS
jgi:diguanylate cyclase (GGDEF)-like protein